MTSNGRRFPDQLTIAHAFEQLLAGRLSRRDFVRAAVQLGATASVAAAMAGYVSPTIAATDGHPRMAGRRPNIILILADDMGFSDLGIMGSEIRTPNIDSMARNGVLLSSMYNAARCCPTRAALLTGLYPHKAGLGHMGADLGTPAYQGYLRTDAATIAELLHPIGYRTLMAGKWHVGGDLYENKIIDVDKWPIGTLKHPSPRQRGFDRFYGIMDGVTSYFSPWCIVEDEKCKAVPPTDFYFTDAITDKAIGMMEESVADRKPFFLYLAHAAPHWPLQAPPSDIAKYENVYAKGWDATRTARHEEMLARGVLQHKWAISPRDHDAPAWGDVKFTDWEASRMAVYAAQIDRMDQQIGRVLTALQRLGQNENTMVLFFSDNGGCAELMREDGWAQYYPNVTNDGKKIRLGNIPNLPPGSEQTFMSYELPWANVSNTPFRLFKHWVHEGGISTPLICQWPERIAKGRIAHAPCHVVDIMPTILEAAGASYPTELAGRALQNHDGESLMHLLQGRPWERQQSINWEHEGNAAARVGQFKLVRKFNEPWELYDMEVDRTELHDLGVNNKQLLNKLVREYQGWAQSVGVIDWNLQRPKLLEQWHIKDTQG